MSPKTILILGAGPRVGYSVAKKFKAEGYQVAVGSRKPDTEAATKAGFFPITVDLTITQSVEEAFATVTKELGVPNIVVYNAAAITFPKDLTDPFSSVSPDAFIKDLNLNLVGTYVALRLAVQGFQTLSAEIPKAFIETGNVLPWKPLAAGVTLGTGKAGVTHLINIAADAYKDKNYRFYFASQVTDEGNAVPNPELDGPAHGKAYWKLANEGKQGAWDVRFLGDGKVVPAK